MDKADDKRRTRPHRRAVVSTAVATGLTGAVGAAHAQPGALLFAADMPRPKGSGWATAADGQRIRWERFGQGPQTVVFVHGWMCDRSYWAPQIARFAQTHQVVALDLPGHGESDKTRKDWSMAAYADDVLRVAAAAAPGRKPVLVGHSMGGLIVLAAGAKASAGTLAGIVPVDILFTTKPMTGGGPRPAPDDFQATTRKMVRDYMFLPTADPARADRIAAAMAAGSPLIANAAGTAMGAVDITATLAGMSALPLSVINSAGRGRATEVAAIRAAHPKARAFVFKDVGHFVMLDDPAGFDAVLSSELVLMSGAATQL